MRGIITFSIAIFFATGSVSFAAKSKAKQAPPAPYYCCEENRKQFCSNRDSEGYAACVGKIQTGKVTVFVVEPKGKPVEITGYCNSHPNHKYCTQITKKEGYDSYQEAQIDKVAEKARLGSERYSLLEKCKERNPHAVLNDKNECVQPTGDYLSEKKWAKSEAEIKKQEDAAKKAEADKLAAEKKKEEDKKKFEAEAPQREACLKKIGQEWKDGKCQDSAQTVAAREKCNTTKDHTWDDVYKVCAPNSSLDLVKLRQTEKDKALKEEQKKAEELKKLANEPAKFDTETKKYLENQKTIADLDAKRRLKALKEKSPNGLSKREQKEMTELEAKFYPEKALPPASSGSTGGTTNPPEENNIEITQAEQTAYDKAVKENSMADGIYGKEMLATTSTGDAIQKSEKSVKNAEDDLDEELDGKETNKVQYKYENAKDIREKVSDKKYGGRYGGLSLESTEKMNQVIDKGIQMGNAANTQIMQMKGANEVNNYQNGSQNLQETQGKLFSIAGTTVTTQAAVETLGALGQAYQSFKHLFSKKNVSSADETATNALGGRRGVLVSEIENLEEQKALVRDESQKAQIEAYISEKERTIELIDSQLAVVSDNSKGEKKQQNEYSLAQGVKATLTGVNAANKMMAASRLQEMAKDAQNPNYYGLNMGGGIVTPGSIDPALTSAPTSDALVDPASLEDESNLGQTPLLDPNIGGDDLRNPLPGANLAMSQQPSAGGGGGSAGSAGGTSKAQDESAGGPAPPKDLKAGSYASSEGGGSGKYSSRGGSTAGGGDVKMDSAFADLLKKFLPGGEEKKEGPVLDLNAKTDRTPASDRAAVIGRNKNIFDEIHKRYQKKNAEGAVTF